MNKLNQRVPALLLALLLCLSLLPALAFADDAEESEEIFSGLPLEEQEEVFDLMPIEEPAEEPIEEPAEEPIEEPAEEPAEEPVEEPAEEPAEEPVEEPAEEPVEEPAEEEEEILVAASPEEEILSEEALGEGVSVTINSSYFPDANFRSFVSRYDSNKDNVLSDSELQAAKDVNCSGRNISNLSGIEYFIYTRILNCSNNKLTQLRLNSPLLEALSCYGNSISSIDLTNCRVLASYLHETPAYGKTSEGHSVKAYHFVNSTGYTKYYCILVDYNVSLRAGIMAQRIYGQNRFETSIKVADALKAAQGVTSFSTVIVANGMNFADALGGSYLAIKKNAPILIVDEKTENEITVCNYITRNLKSNGKVYLLGGPAVVPETVRTRLDAAGFTVKRLYGQDRYETNLAILREAGISSGTKILVASGLGFADSLSASASGLPILLVGNSLTAAQRSYLGSELRGTHSYTIIGGTGAVSDSVKSSLSAYGSVSRIAGKNRYETSVNVAKELVSSPSNVMFCYGQNFPDGLCGAPLAAALNASVILIANNNLDQAAAYMKEFYSAGSAPSGIVLGGPALLSDNTVNAIVLF